VGKYTIYDWKLYSYTGNQRQAIDVPAQPAVDAQTNHVTVAVDGTTVDDSDFGTSFAQDYPLGDQYVTHDYTVTVTAYDDADGAAGRTFTKTETSTACDMPIVDAVPGATITAQCGAADIDLTNAPVGETVNKTASYVIYVDGTFNTAAAVESGKTESHHLDFAANSGDHTVVVRTGPAFGDVLVAQQSVKTDCGDDQGGSTPGGNQGGDPSGDPSGGNQGAGSTSTPAAGDPAVTTNPSPAAPTQTKTDALAQTGSDAVWPLFGGLAVMVLGGAALAVTTVRRRRA